MNDSTLELIIKAKNQASKELNDVKKSSDDLDRAWSGLKSGAKTAGIAAIAATGAVVGFGVSAVKSFAESESAIAQTNAVLKSTKGIAGVTAEQIDNLSSSLQKTTKYSDEQIRSGQNMLLTFTKIGKDVFPQATETILDMSTALGQDLQSSSIQLGKALQDPIRGITALRRVGVNFTDAQKEQIEAMVKAGDVMGAQKLILQELQTEFGGSAKAAGETFAGKLAILKNQFDEVKESIGGVLVTALTPLMQRLADFVASDQFQAWLARVSNWLAINLPIAANYLATVVIPTMVNAFNLVWPVIETVIGWLADLIGWVSRNSTFVYGLIGAITTLYTLMKAKAAFDIIYNSIALLIAKLAGASAQAGSTKQAFVLLNNYLSGFAGFGIIAAAAVAAGIIILNEANKAKAAWDNAHASIDASSRSQEDATKRLQQLRKTGTPEQQARALKSLQSMAGRASGGPVSMGKTYMVGEEGPELFTPKSNGSIVPNDKLGSGGGSTEVNYNGPIYLQTADAVREFFDIQNSNKRFVNKGIAPIRG